MINRIHNVPHHQPAVDLAINVGERIDLNKHQKTGAGLRVWCMRLFGNVLPILFVGGE